MKNILYLHGLDGNPKKEKVDILASKGSPVTAPLIDYRKYTGSLELFDQFVKLINEKHINFIVGSSMGGYFGFYLSAYCDIPALLFNPALHSMSINVPVRKATNRSRRIIVLGKYDDTIPPQKTIDFIKQGDYDNIEIFERENAHQVPLEVFSVVLDYI